VAAEKQTGAFLIARDMWGWVAALWQRHVAARPILWFLIAYVCVIATVIGWRYVEHSAFLAWEFWEGAKPQAGNAPDARNLPGGPEGIRNLVWSLATLFGGAAAVVGIILAARRTKAANHQAEAALKQSETAFQSLVTERFTKAVEQLGHEKRAVRLGAIYALERIARDSPRDRDTIVETLAAYIRELAPWPPRHKNSLPFDDSDLEGEEQAIERNPMLLRPPVDISAATIVICRLLPDRDAMRPKTDLRYADLRGLDAPNINLSEMQLDHSNLRRANLNWANLNRARMAGSILEEAHLDSDANLSNANLNFAKMSRANMTLANLHLANLFMADMSSAILDQADLSNAHLGETNLSGAYMRGADLSEADLVRVRNLIQKQIDGIRYLRNNPPINLPDGLTLPEPYGG